MATHKALWALILFHLFHNRERKQESLWIILELQHPFHPGMWKSHFPLTDLVISWRWRGSFLRREVTPQPWALSHLLWSTLVKLSGLERSQGGVVMSLGRDTTAKSFYSSFPLLTWSCAQVSSWKEHPVLAWAEVLGRAELEKWGRGNNWFSTSTQ